MSGLLPDELVREAAALLQLCRERGAMLATAESCTGGLIAACLTEVAGSSDVLDRGFVTYSNQAKQEMLGVPAAVLAEHGAVSEPVARAMAAGAIARSRALLSVAVTGIAGPGGGSAGKPVGLVHLATAGRDGGQGHRRLELGAIGRGAIREESVRVGFAMLREALRGRSP